MFLLLHLAKDLEVGGENALAIDDEIADGDDDDDDDDESSTSGSRTTRADMIVCTLRIIWILLLKINIIMNSLLMFTHKKK